MTENQAGKVALRMACVLAGVLILSMPTACGRREVTFSTPYQAVLLSNGAVYFGRLQGYGGTQPVLTDVFYIVSQTDPITKQTNNVLIKRGKELHEPDRMYLNPGLIVFVEPVGPGSKVAQLIAHSK